MRVLRNPLRHKGFSPQAGLAEGRLIDDPSEPLNLLRLCPCAKPTPLLEILGLAGALGVGMIYLKDERERMGLGNFKALGAAYVIARQAFSQVDDPDSPIDHDQIKEILRGTVFACASAGNHGLSVAAGARVFGAKAVVYLSHTVPEDFAERLRCMGAEVVRAGNDYEASMAVAVADAERHKWILLSDSSWPGNVELPTRVMEGYLVMGAEIVDQISLPPQYIFLQAGVGGMAAAMTILFRKRWGNEPVIVIVEPEAAPALIDSICSGAPVKARGPHSTMGRLDCKEPSHLALAELARHADFFVTVTDEECEATVRLLENHNVTTTPSAAAGVAALHHSGNCRDALGLTAQARVLAIITEKREGRHKDK
ncbi:MAG: pyridoxal-phosphate dependent enzyme [Proteobacteria bacterium]|nr:MAG: pyridoxal-phosphate dependent enzyme [Pseudomonadota bacterium]